MDTPFIADSDVRYGDAVQVTPLIRRLVARNPGPFTYTGSGTYIIGSGHVAVIDPGPDLPEHIDAILAATHGETISHLVITHTHRDHSPAAAPLKARTGALVVGCAPIAVTDDGPKVEEAFDTSYAPDWVMADGDVINGPGWTLSAVTTPGHTSNHVCFALAEEQALFTGDHVMGWSTTVVAPPDGNMAQYLASLRKLLERDDQTVWPTHGQPITNPKPFVRALIAHRKQREGQIMACLKEGASTIPTMVARMYANVDPRLHGAAGRSVLAHLIDLQDRGLVHREADVFSVR
jgi:glyoxylase-like metal-dependent hydrolase (beta-lactamase superfamily II)